MTIDARESRGRGVGAMRLFIGTLVALAFQLPMDGSAAVVRESPPPAAKVSMCTLQADPAAYNHKMIDDALFRRFDMRVRSPGDVRFRAHLIGRFFAGLKQHTPNGDIWGGYGHFGCCSLLVIQQVLAVEAKAD